MSERAISGRRKVAGRVTWTALALLLLSVAGLLISGYLTWLHWSGAKALCAGVGDCELVNTSEYSAVGRIPVALLGFLMYLTFCAVGILRLRTGESLPPELNLAVFTVALIGVSFSAYLTYVELFVLHAICPWCVSSAVLVTAIFILSVLGLREVT